jgi:hypothetical protein
MRKYLPIPVNVVTICVMLVPAELIAADRFYYGPIGFKDVNYGIPPFLPLLKGGKFPLYQEGCRGVFIPSLAKRGKGRFFN